MIVVERLDFRDKRTAAGRSVRKCRGLERQGWKRLAVLEAAVSTADLRGPPSNRLDASR